MQFKSNDELYYLNNLTYEMKNEKTDIKPQAFFMFLKLDEFSKREF